MLPLRSPSHPAKILFPGSGSPFPVNSPLRAGHPQALPIILPGCPFDRVGGSFSLLPAARGAGRMLRQQLYSNRAPVHIKRTVHDCPFEADSGSRTRLFGLGSQCSTDEPYLHIVRCDYLPEIDCMFIITEDFRKVKRNFKKIKNFFRPPSTSLRKPV